MKGFTGNFMWKEFITDCGDTIGGILIGIGSQNKEDRTMFFLDIILVGLATTLKYNKYKNKNEDIRK